MPGARTREEVERLADAAGEYGDVVRLLAWMQTLALTEHPARRWEPKRLRLRLLSIAGRLAATGRRRWLHLAVTAPFTDLALDALHRLDALAAPG